jgi:hypothetical protein
VTAASWFKALAPRSRRLAVGALLLLATISGVACGSTPKADVTPTTDLVAHSEDGSNTVSHDFVEEDIEEPIIVPEVLEVISLSPVPPGQTSVEPAVCAELPPVPSSVSSSVVADLVGDGLEDTLSVYGDEESEKWYLQVDFGSGFAAEVSFDRDLFFGVAPYVYSVFDIEGDGSLEIFLANGGGAHTEAIHLFDVQPCEIKEVGYGQDQEDAVLFFLGYGALSQGGLACSDGELRNIWAHRDTLEGPFDVNVITYTLEGHSLIQLSHLEDTLSEEELNALYDPPCSQAG